MIDLVINDIKIYFRLKKNSYIKLLLYIIPFVLIYYNIRDNMFGKYSESIFIFLFGAILMEGIYSIKILSVSKAKVDNTRFILTLPINIKLFILSKDLLLFLVLLVQLVLLELIFIMSGILSTVHLIKFPCFIVGIILDIAFANIIFKIDHKKELPDGLVNQSIAEGFKWTFNICICTIIILFLVLNMYINIIIKVLLSVAFYAFSVKTLEKDMINQGKFLEEVDLI